MSVKVMSLVWESELPPMERLVLLAVADFCDDEGKCWPSVGRIARKCGLKERGVRGILRRLEEQGWLKTAVGGGRHGCSEYHLKPGTTCPPAPHAPRHDTTETRHETAQNPAPHAPEPSRTVKEPSVTPLTPRDVLRNVLSETVVDDFIDHRKSKRAKLTVRAAQLIAKDLALCDDPDAEVLRSIKNGWTGVFPEKGKEASSGSDIAKRAAANWSARRMDSGPSPNPSQPLLSARQSPGRDRERFG